jgi:hypothetical protein
VDSFRHDRPRLQPLHDVRRLRPPPLPQGWSDRLQMRITRYFPYLFRAFSRLRGKIRTYFRPDAGAGREPLPPLEYMADFCLLSRKALTPAEYDVFRFYFLLGGDWRLCCRRLNMDRGNFYHTVYRVEQKLGYVFRSVEPYALFPLDEYFGGATRLQIDDSRTVGTEARTVQASAEELLEDDFDPGDLEMDLKPAPQKKKRVIPIRAPLAKVRAPKPEEEAA